MSNEKPSINLLTNPAEKFRSAARMFRIGKAGVAFELYRGRMIANAQ